MFVGRVATVRPRSRGRSVGGGVAELSLVGDYCCRNLLSLTDDCL